MTSNGQLPVTASSPAFAIQRFFAAALTPVRRPVGREAAPILGGQDEAGHLSTLQNRRLSFSIARCIS